MGRRLGLDLKLRKLLRKKSDLVIDVVRKAIPSRGFVVSKEELAAHQEFIRANFKTNLWGY